MSYYGCCLDASSYIMLPLCVGIVLLLPTLVIHPSQVRAGSDPSSVTDLKSQSPHLSRAYDYESTDSDVDRPDPDVVLDDLASRRFHSPTPFAPTNFAIPIKPLGAAAIPSTNVTVTNVPQQTLTRLRSEIIDALVWHIVRVNARSCSNLRLVWFCCHDLDDFLCDVNNGWFDVL